MGRAVEINMIHESSEHIPTQKYDFHIVLDWLNPIEELWIFHNRRGIVVLDETDLRR